MAVQYYQLLLRPAGLGLTQILIRVGPGLLALGRRLREHADPVVPRLVPQGLAGDSLFCWQAVGEPHGGYAF